MAADCKSALLEYVGSNPTPSTTLRPYGLCVAQPKRRTLERMPEYHFSLEMGLSLILSYSFTAGKLFSQFSRQTNFIVPYPAN